MLKLKTPLLVCCINLCVYAQLTPTYVVNIPMRDGKSLAADVYVPTACTSCPTILIQTPYNKNNFRNGLPLGFKLNLQASPYSWVVVDWRGFYASSAAAITQPNRGQDGYDVVDWIKSQPWSSGKIGTWGPSALGGIQYLTAKENHPNHTCAVPQVAHPQTAYSDYFYGGVLEKSRLQTLDALGYGLSPLVLSNTYYSTLWQYSESTTWYPASIHIPTLQIGGWYDHNIDKMMDWYKATRTSADVSVKDEQWLLVGPWVHGGTGAAYVGSSVQGELTYPNAAFKSDTMARDFFAHYLLNTNNNWKATPKITYYELGNNIWNYSSSNSIEAVGTNNLFMNENNMLTAQNGNNSSAFVSDPRNPSPTLGGATLSIGLDQGPYNQVALESRSDIQTFSTGSLLTDVSVSGRVKLNLYIQCNQPDADISVRLTDVYPDSRNMLINDGIKRMRFRTGFTKANETFMSIGQVYNVEVELPFVNYTWKVGHKLKVYIGGNSATRWDVNLQNGGTMYVAGDTNTATIQIHHNTQYPSKISLPGNNPTLAVNNKLATNTLDFFPNPATEFITVLPNNNIQLTRVEIKDVLGNNVMDKITNSATVNISGLDNGVYLLQAYSNEGFIGSLKFIKTR